MQEPIHIISLGAGVQSSTMALMAAKGEITPMPVAAIFADTQAEPKSVYTWLDWLEKQLPFPVHRVTAGNVEHSALTLRIRVDSKGFWSKSNIPAFVITNDGKDGMAPRQCTENYKIKPLRRASRKLASVPRGCKEVRVIQWIGISSDESLRMKESRDVWQKNRWPLIELGMSRRDCLKWMEENGFPTPPKSACYFCPFKSDKQWRELKELEPDLFQRAILFERAYRGCKELSGFNGNTFLHPSRQPLSEVDFSTEEERGQLNMFNNECEGMCGV